MATDDEIVVRLTAQTDQLKAGMAEASASVQTSADAMAGSFSNATASYAAFDAIQKANLSTAAEVAAAQRTINEVQATGAFTAEELAAKQELVDVAMLKVGKETQAASGFLSMFTRNSRTMYSTSALITDAMTGQFSRMRREVAALGNETGIMASAFRVATGPVGAVAATIAAAGFAAVEANDAFARFEQVVNESGGIIGMSAGQLQQMAVDIGNVTGKTFDASDAVRQLGASGRFTGDELRLAATGAVEFAAVTGEKMDEVVKKFIELDKDPKKAIVDLNDQFHVLTQTEADQIVQMIKVGNTAGATRAILEALARSSADRTAAMDKDANVLARAWDHVKNSAEQALEVMGQRINVKLGGGDTAQKLAVAKQDMEELAAEVRAGFSSETPALEAATAKVRELTAELNKQTAAQRAVSDAQRRTAQTLDASLGKGSGSGIGGLEQQFQEQEARSHASYDQMKQDAADFWNEQATDAKNSAAVQAQAWQKYIQVRHELDAQGLAADNEATRRQEENARKGAEAAKQAAQDRARAERQAGQEIQDEIKKEAAAQDAANLAKIQGARTSATARIAANREIAQEEYTEGNITAKQLLQIEQDLVRQELAAEIAYYKAKEKLDQGNVAAVTRDTTAIFQATQKARQRDAKDEQKFHQNSIKEWRKYSQQVAGMVASQTSAILFQHQSLKNALANILESMATDWIASEARKLAATIGFGAQETATKEAQRATNTAADIADKSAAAVRAAGLAGAQGVASFAAAPWPVDIGAPAFGAAMFAAAASFGSIASAAGGWDRVPADGMRTELHRDEMVLPKHVADPVRKAAQSGFQGGGGMNVSIQTHTPRDFAAYLKRNPAALRQALGHARRNGW